VTRILAIDPGPELSAYVLYDSDIKKPVSWQKAENDSISRVIVTPSLADEFVCEMIASYGMSVGASVFTTCVWIGRFVQRWEGKYPTTPHRLVYRKDVKMHLCGDPRAKDANIRQAIIDLYGGKEKAIGKKASPGPLFGISGDVWSALAVAITAAETETP